MNTDKVLGMIGLAKRAGKVVSGEFLCEKAIKERAAKLVVIACDTSDGGKKSIRDACNYYKIRYIEYGDKESLGKFTGGGGQRAALAVTDRRFAGAIMEKYSAGRNNG